MFCNGKLGGMGGPKFVEPRPCPNNFLVKKIKLQQWGEEGIHIPYSPSLPPLTFN